MVRGVRDQIETNARSAIIRARLEPHLRATEGPYPVRKKRKS
jgi:hypothetical protein